MGWVAQTSHRISLAYLVPLLCYCVVALYSFLRTSQRQPAAAEKLA
jgi:fucose permease